MHRWTTRSAVLYTTSSGLLREDRTPSQAFCGEYSLLTSLRTPHLWRNWAGCTAIDKSRLTMFYWWQKASDVTPPLQQQKQRYIGGLGARQWQWTVVCSDRILLLNCVELGLRLIDICVTRNFGCRARTPLYGKDEVEPNYERSALRKVRAVTLLFILAVSCAFWVGRYS